MLQKCSLNKNSILPYSYIENIGKGFFKKSLFLVFFLLTINSFGQEKSKLSPYKIGFLFNHANEKNFLFDDKDYSYQTNLYKAQLFYKLGSWKTLNFELIAQPQVHFIRHKLLNKFFVQPRYGDNYLALRKVYTKRKAMNLYGLEFGLGIKKQLLNKLNTQLTIGLGFAYIDTTTERLASGFTFIENFSLGFNYKTSTKTSVYLGGNFGHVSNLDFQFPNDGYNVLGLEVGFLYSLE